MLAGRLSEDLVARWLRGRGLVAERFPPRRRRLSKTPDFRVVSAAGDVFLCEVKTLVRAEPGYGGVFLKLLRARAQFDAVNQGGHLANVLAFVAATPDLIAPMLVELAPQPAAPLQGIDLILGFGSDGGRVSVLHEAAGSRHARLLAGVRPDAPAGVLGEAM